MPVTALPFSTSLCDRARISAAITQKIKKSGESGRTRGTPVPAHPRGQCTSMLGATVRQLRHRANADAERDSDSDRIATDHRSFDRTFARDRQTFYAIDLNR